MNSEFGDFSNQQSFGSHVIEFIQTLVIFAVVAIIVYAFIAQPHKVSGSSMFPNLHHGDYLITDKLSYRFNPPQRGQIIVFKNPREESQDYIKRIIGLPGEKVKVQDGHIYVDGKTLKESYLSPEIITNPGAFLQEGQEIAVEKERYLVVGDNRPASSDSREWGFITKEEIIGKAFLRYWPINSTGIISAATY